MGKVGEEAKRQGDAFAAGYSAGVVRTTGLPVPAPPQDPPAPRDPPAPCEVYFVAATPGTVSDESEGPADLRLRLPSLV